MLNKFYDQDQCNNDPRKYWLEYFLLQMNGFEKSKREFSQEFSYWVCSSKFFDKNSIYEIGIVVREKNTRFEFLYFIDEIPSNIRIKQVKITSKAKKGISNLIKYHNNWIKKREIFTN